LKGYREVPAVIPETRPVPEPMVATAVVAELHVPLPVISASVAEVPEQMAVVPVITAGTGFTVTTVEI
jgi:hypothetical protein